MTGTIQKYRIELRDLETSCGNASRIETLATRSPTMIDTTTGTAEETRPVQNDGFVIPLDQRIDRESTTRRKSFFHVVTASMNRVEVVIGSIVIETGHITRIYLALGVVLHLLFQERGQVTGQASREVRSVCATRYRLFVGEPLSDDAKKSHPRFRGKGVQKESTRHTHITCAGVGTHRRTISVTGLAMIMKKAETEGRYHPRTIGHAT